MGVLMKTTLGVVVLLVSTLVYGKAITPEEKKSDFVQLASLIKSKYGPYEYKKKNLKIDVDKLVEDYSKRAEKTTNLQFYYLINQFVAEFKDSHFKASVQTNRVSTLGLLCERIEGKVLVDQYIPLKASANAMKIRKGDEVVSIDKKPAKEIVENLATYISAGFNETALRMATWYLGHRTSSTLPPMDGKTTVEFKNQDGDLYEVELEWVQMGESIDELERTGSGLNTPLDLTQLSLFDYYKDLPKTEFTYRCSGKSRIARPKGAVSIFETPFVAYYFDTPKGKVGYLRIPHYSWNNETTGANETDLRLANYEYALQVLEKNTVGLIIDQDHNCGGYVTMVEKMASMFVDKSYPGLEFQLLSTRAERKSFEAGLTEDVLKTTMGAGLLEVLNLMKQANLSGERLTTKTTLHGSQPIYPNSIRYTKPIVMLIDEMSGSGGDAFPAIMQGLGRAKLMGTRTMGAGGHVVTTDPLNYSFSSLRITKSLFYHPNGTAIENNGASPDYPYTITQKDFLYGYGDYLKTAVEKLLP